mgnify:CR=1 FL=1
MTAVLALLEAFAAASLFGAMVFFAAVVAPRVFTALDPDQAGRFLRAIFPWYYLFLTASAGLAAIALGASGDYARAGAAGLIAVSALGVKLVLVPQINAWRDAALDGDTGAERRFNAGHRATVLLNVVHLGLAGWLVAALAL